MTTPPWSDLEACAPLDAVAGALLSLGATCEGRRATGFALGGHTLLTEYHDAARVTSVRVVGERPVEIACWLLDQLSELSPSLVLRS